MIMRCPNCGLRLNRDLSCPNCSKPVMEASPASPISPQKRKQILQATIQGYLNQGYRVVSQTDATAQLVKPKSFSLFWGCLFTIFVLPLLVYIAWYLLVERDEQAYIHVDDFGRVRVTRSRAG